MCKTCSFDVAIRNSYNMGRNAIFDLCWPSPRAHNTLGRGWYKLNMTRLPMFSTNLCWYCVGDLLTVASDLEFLGRQADHSRSVPIVILHYRQNSGYSQVLSQTIMNRLRQFILRIMHFVNPVLQLFLVCHIGFVTWAHLWYRPHRVIQGIYVF